MTTEMLLGDEAVALGALHSGIGGAFSYPGTPATEILEFVQARADSTVSALWSAKCMPGSSATARTSPARAPVNAELMG